MKVICSWGNLGNQIFYSAFEAYLHRMNPKEKVFYFHVPGCPKITVNKCFLVGEPKQSFFINILSFVIFYLDLITRKTICKHGLPKRLVCGWNDSLDYHSVFYSNYLQCKDFYQNLNSSWLQIRMPETISEGYCYFEKLIKENDSICVHVRRGDYISTNSSYADLASTDYYERAIELARNKYPKAPLFFFSDDLDYVKQKYQYDDSHFVDCNRGEYSYLDIKLMSLARVNIIANSTFSYWGAYMGHENKMVIAPSRWFSERTGRDAPEIMMNDWIII